MPKTQLPLSRIRRLFLTLAVGVFLFGFGYRLGQQNRFQVNFHQGVPQIQIPSVNPSQDQVDFSLFWEVWRRLQADYLHKDELDTTKMTYGAISGLVKSLGDPYSVFLDPHDNQLAKDDLEGSFSGVGIQLGYKQEQITVIAPLSGSPAQQAGVKAGDIIVKIDDQSTVDMSLPEAVDLIRGPQGSPVILGLLSLGDNQPHDATITRDQITVPSVSLTFLNSPDYSVPEAQAIAYIQVTRFSEQTQTEWQQAVDEAVGRSHQLVGVVLDLRNNPGGLMDQSVPIVSEFVESGAVLYQEDKNGNQKPYLVTGQGRFFGTPLAVLVNQGSASASEIVAGALQEYHRAQLVGQTTFGKGTIQDAQDLAGGSGLHLTTGRWLLPSKNHLDGQGLTPDVVVEIDPQTASQYSNPDKSDPQLLKAVEVVLQR